MSTQTKVPVLDQHTAGVVAASDGATTYAIPCRKCQAPFDALAADWCSCLVSERTLVCPACASCFCRAATTYKQRVWRYAPRALWDRKFKEHYAENSIDEAAQTRPLVLLVDDESDIRRLAGTVIRSLGYGLLVAKDGEQGLELAREYRPDLVLADALMPRMDGREMCRQIKDDWKCYGTRVVVMTALYTNYRYQREAFESYKVDGYLVKPLAVDSLSALLKKELR
jgi:CheY-like chemotaxis protein